MIKFSNCEGFTDFVKKPDFLQWNLPAGMIVTSQTDADKLPTITEDFAYKRINEAVVHVNTNLAKGYNRTTESA